jgi:hypothetical protein
MMARCVRVRRKSSHRNTDDDDRLSPHPARIVDAEPVIGRAFARPVGIAECERPSPSRGG